MLKIFKGAIVSTPKYTVYVQVFAEFHRITNVNLRNQFYCGLDRYTPKLVALYRQKSSRTGKGAEALREMLRIYDLEVSLFPWGYRKSNVLSLQIRYSLNFKLFL